MVFSLASISWVHRDLSVSNIFSFGGALKLGDLEYAKQFGRSKDFVSHDVRTVSHTLFDHNMVFLQA